MMIIRRFNLRDWDWVRLIKMLTYVVTAVFFITILSTLVVQLFDEVFAGKMFIVSLTIYLPYLLIAYIVTSLISWRTSVNRLGSQIDEA